MNSTTCTLGFIWDGDIFVPVPTAPLRPPLCWNILNLPERLQKFVQSDGPRYAGKAFMGASMSTIENSEASGLPLSSHSRSFNFLDGNISTDWRIDQIGFSYDGDGRLSGLQVTYRNGTRLEHGT